MKFTIFLLLLSLAGCVSGSITTTREGECHAQFTSLFKSAESLKFCGFESTSTKSNDELLLQLLQRP